MCECECVGVCVCVCVCIHMCEREREGGRDRVGEVAREIATYFPLFCICNILFIVKCSGLSTGLQL